MSHFLHYHDLFAVISFVEYDSVPAVSHKLSPCGSQSYYPPEKRYYMLNDIMSGLWRVLHTHDTGLNSQCGVIRSLLQSTKAGLH